MRITHFDFSIYSRKISRLASNSAAVLLLYVDFATNDNSLSTLFLTHRDLKESSNTLKRLVFRLRTLNNEQELAHLKHVVNQRSRFPGPQRECAYLPFDTTTTFLGSKRAVGGGVVGNPLAAHSSPSLDIKMLS